MNEIAARPVVETPTQTEITPPRLIAGDRIDRLGILYEFKEKDVGRKKFTRVDTGAEVWLDNIELLTGMSRREIRLALPSWLPSRREKIWRRDFVSMPDHEKRRARMRLAYVEAFVRNRALGYPLKVREALERAYAQRTRDGEAVLADELQPSLAAVYEWLALWDQPGPKSIKRLCFAESERGVRGPQLAEEIVPILWNAVRELWYSPQRHRVRLVYDRVVAEADRRNLPESLYPCRRTVRRIVDSLPPYAVMQAREGKRIADNEYRQKGQLARVELPGQVYELDAHKLDAIGVEHRMRLPLGRLWVTVVIDRCTRLIVGFHIHVEPPSALTVAAALRNAFAPKLYMLNRWPDIGRPWVAWGLPQLVVLDNGLENHAKFLTEALEELGVNWVFALPREPEFKAHIERWFGTLARDFSSRLPGWTGSNPQEKADYDSTEMACLDLFEVDELLHRWVTIYNVDWHEGIRDIPERLWIEKTAEFEVTPLEDIGMLDILLGDYAERTVNASGIHLLGLRYGDLGENRPLELIRTRAGSKGLKKVRIRFDRSDLSHIYVQDPETKEYLWVSSLDLEYTTDLTLAQHRIIRRHAVERCRGYVSIGELCRARDDLQCRIEELTGSETMTERRFAAVFRGLGSKGSWADFYRLFETEYGANRKENKERSVVSLLEADEVDGIVPDIVLPSEIDAEKAEPEPIASRAERLGVSLDMPEEPGSPLTGASGGCAATQIPSAPDQSELSRRMAALGMRVEEP